MWPVMNIRLRGSCYASDLIYVELAKMESVDIRCPIKRLHVGDGPQIVMFK